jgi:HlyD family secretion protein
MKKTSILFILMLSNLFMYSCHNKDNKYKNYLKGKVKSEHVAVAPKVLGRIISILVSESQIVNKGDTLAILDIPEIEAKLKQANGAFESAKAQYEMALAGATGYERKQIDAMYKAASEQFAFAEKSYLRLKNMYSDSLIPAQQYDDIYSKYMGAMAQLEAAEARRADIIKGTRNERIRMAMGDMLRAEGALQEAKTAFSERFLVAPATMTIETIALQQGELALPGYNLFIGYIANSSYFRFTVSESKIHSFTNGNEYEVILPYQDNKAIAAKLVGIKQLNSYASLTSVFPDYQLGESVYELKLMPTIREGKLFTNMTVLLEEK